MNPRVIDAADVAPQTWANGGGHTRELLTWPAGANWALRISLADVERDGPFSAYSGVERWFAVVHGAGVVLRFPEGTRTQTRLDAPLCFNGGAAPACALIDGETRDLNLMQRGGRAHLSVVDGMAWRADFRQRGLFTAQPGEWRGGGHCIALPALTLLWCDATDDKPWTFTAQAVDAAPGWWLGFSPGGSA